MKHKCPGARSTIIAAATLASLQIVNAKDPMPSPETGKDKHATTTHDGVKAETIVTIVGVANGQAVYQGSKGEIFTLNAKTGDKIPFDGKAKSGGTGGVADYDGLFWIVGKDSKGRVVCQDAKGKKFTLN